MTSDIEDEFEKWYNRSLKFLSFRPRSRKEIADYLVSKKTAPTVVSFVLDKLTSVHLLDDWEFCRWFIDQRKSFRPHGRQLLRLELIKKGIDKEIIDQVLNEQLPKTQEKELVREIIAKKLKSWGRLPPEEQKKKIQGFLLRRGFSWEIVTEITKTVRFVS